ncbi:unnamed protein product [Boreogadus saida]
MEMRCSCLADLALALSSPSAYQHSDRAERMVTWYTEPDYRRCASADGHLVHRARLQTLCFSGWLLEKKKGHRKRTEESPGKCSFGVGPSDVIKASVFSVVAA